MAIIRKSLAQIKDIQKNPSNEDKIRHAKLLKLKEKDIDYSDIPDFLSDPNFWDTHSIKETPKAKKQISLRLEPELLDWYKSQGKGYQTLMKKVLTSYSKHK
jgi:uncharacterized protein (DUF4415 family)